MKTVIVLISIILGSIIVYGQKEAELYVIGIGGDNPATYWEVLDFLNASQDVKVIKSCALVQGIAVKVVNNAFRDYTDFLLYLNFNFDELRVYRKDMDVFVKQCDDESKKE